MNQSQNDVPWCLITGNVRDPLLSEIASAEYWIGSLTIDAKRFAAGTGRTDPSSVKVQKTRTTPVSTQCPPSHCGPLHGSGCLLCRWQGHYANSAKSLQGSGTTEPTPMSGLLRPRSEDDQFTVTLNFLTHKTDWVLLFQGWSERSMR